MNRAINKEIDSVIKIFQQENSVPEIFTSEF